MPTAKGSDPTELVEHAGKSWQPRQGQERNRQIYISESVWWCLHVRAKGLNGDGPIDHTADQFVDDILRQWCRVNLPEIVKLREKYDQLNDQQKEIFKAAIKAASTKEK